MLSMSESGAKLPTKPPSRTSASCDRLDPEADVPTDLTARRNQPFIQVRSDVHRRPLHGAGNWLERARNVDPAGSLQEMRSETASLVLRPSACNRLPLLSPAKLVIRRAHAAYATRLDVGAGRDVCFTSARARTGCAHPGRRPIRQRKWHLAVEARCSRSRRHRR